MACLYPASPKHCTYLAPANLYTVNVTGTIYQINVGSMLSNNKKPNKQTQQGGEGGGWGGVGGEVVVVVVVVRIYTMGYSCVVVPYSTAPANFFSHAHVDI